VENIMKKMELLESVITNANSGEKLEIGESCRYNIDDLTNSELRTLLHKDFKNYDIYKEFHNDNMIVIERVA